MGWQDAPVIDEPAGGSWTGAPTLDTPEQPPTADADFMALEQGPTSDRPISDIPLALSQGITAGHMDELGAWLKSKVSGRPYEETIKETRGRFAEIPTEVSLPGEFGGAILTTMAFPALAPTRVANLYTKLPKWLQTTGLGGLWGALFGAGNAEDNKLQSMATGGALGAATGGVLHGGVTVGKKTYGGVARYLQGLTQPEIAAARKLGERLTEDGLTLNRLKGRMDFLGPEATIADAGGSNVVDLARGAAALEGGGRNRINMMMRQRNESEGSRIVGKVKEHLGPADYFDQEEKLLSKLAQAGQEAYTPAYEANTRISTPALERLLENKAIRAALREASFIANTEAAAGQASKWVGPVDEELMNIAGALKSGRNKPAVMSLETWDYVKRGIDSVMDGKAYRNELTGKLNKKGRALNLLRKKILSELDQATGGASSLYKKARKEYGDDAEILDALREGQKFMRLSPEQIRKRLGELSEAGKAAYRNSAGRAIVDLVENTPDNSSAARKLFSKTLSRKKIASLFPEREGFMDFSKLMSQEMRFSDVSRALGTGGSSAAAGADISEARTLAGNVGAIAGTKIPGTHQLVMSGIVRRLVQKLIGPQTEANAAIARMTVSRDPAVNAETFKLLEPYVRDKPETHRLLRATLLGGVQAETRASSELLTGE